MADKPKTTTKQLKFTCPCCHAEITVRVTNGAAEFDEHAAKTIEASRKVDRLFSTLLKAFDDLLKSPSKKK